MNRRLFLSFTTALSALGASIALGPAEAAPLPNFTFPSIDGGMIDSADWIGHPVLVVNTASLRDMQAMHEDLGPDGLIVLAVPSNDFNQELDDARKVKEYCAVQYAITLPVTDIVHVARNDVHPFYAWVRDQTGFVPSWNFGKVLISPEGEILGTWGSVTKPDARPILGAIRPYLSPS